MAQMHELIHSYYQAFNEGRWTAMLDLLHDDVVHDINQGGRETGKRAFEAFLQRMARCYAERLSDIVVMADEGRQRAAAEYVVHGTYRVADDGLPPAHGQTYRLAGGAFFAAREGRIARITNYYNLEDWLAQVRGT